MQMQTSQENPSLALIVHQILDERLYQLKFFFSLRTSQV